MLVLSESFAALQAVSPSISAAANTNASFLFMFLSFLSYCLYLNW